jgi:hypothetical protein
MEAHTLHQKLTAEVQKKKHGARMMFLGEFTKQEAVEGRPQGCILWSEHPAT